MLIPAVAQTAWRNKEGREIMADHGQSKCLPFFFTPLSPGAGPGNTETSSMFPVRLERTWISHSGNNMLRNAMKLSFASE